MYRPYDPYKVLGISRQSTKEQIQRAFRTAALKLHPDRNPDPRAAERFMEAQAAYDALRNPQSRELIDRELNAAERAAKQAAEAATPKSARPKQAPKRVHATDADCERLQELISRGQIFEAEHFARHLLHKYPKDARLHAQLGELLTKHRDWARASRSYVIAVQLDPQNKRYLEMYEFIERKREQFDSSLGLRAATGVVFAIYLAAAALVQGIILVWLFVSNGVEATLVAMLALIICGILSGSGLRLLHQVPLYPCGGPKAWFGTGLAIAFISAVVAFPVQKIWERGKSTTYPGFGKLLVACILAAAFLALFQLQNLPGALATLLFGSGAMFTGVYVVSRG